jgi:hypothetical protein
MLNEQMTETDAALDSALHRAVRAVAYDSPPPLACALDDAVQRANRLRGVQRQGRIGAALIVVLLGTAAALLLPGQRSTAWARIDGVVMVYDVFTPRYAETPSLQYPAEIIVAPDVYRESGYARISAVVEAWVAEQPDTAPEGSKLAWVEWLQDSNAAAFTQPRPARAPINYFGSTAQYGVFLMTTDTALQAELQARLACVPGVLGSPAVEAKADFYQRRYANLFDGRHMVTVDGAVYRFPDDFAPDEVQTVMGWLNSNPGSEFYWLNFAGLVPGLEQRLKIGGFTLVRLTEQGNLEIDTLSAAPVPAPPLEYEGKVLGLQGVGTPRYSYRPKKDAPGEYDRIERSKDDVYRLLSQDLQRSQPAPDSYVEAFGWQLQYLLYPLELWQPGLTPEQYGKTDALRTQAEELFAQYLAVAQQFERENPGLLKLSPMLHPFDYTPFFAKNKVENEVFRVMLYADEAVLRTLKERLDAVPGLAPPVVARVGPHGFDKVTGERVQ